MNKLRMILMVSIIFSSYFLVSCAHAPPPAPAQAQVQAAEPTVTRYAYESPVDPSTFMDWDVYKAIPLGNIFGTGDVYDIYATNPEKEGDYPYCDMLWVRTAQGPHLIGFGLVSANFTLTVYELALGKDDQPVFRFVPCDYDHQETYELFKESMQEVFGILIVIPKGA